MDQQKIGAFLKDLRKERNITQEQLADKMMVSRRTVSRWETGSNMPDLDILIDISEYYNVDLKEILNGERKEKNMDTETKDTIMKVAEYSNDEKEKMMKRFHMTGKRVSTAFSMAGTSVPEFIRECRLEHARQLIVERPDMTLVEIATASGFVHASTFTVDFKNKYGVSPTKYREEKQKEKNVVQRE